MNLSRLIRRAWFLSERKRLEFFPAFWLMRIKVLEISDNWRTVRIRLPLTQVSRNMGGFMFGGFQASLADPVAALACARNFPGYAVWTRALKLDFLHEGRTDLELRFRFDPQQEEAIRRELAQRGRSNPVFEFGYYLTDGTLCTRISNTVAIRPQGYRRKT
jgi:acyl-coenzyme A thioesterase PaaI-like protein